MSKRIAVLVRVVAVLVVAGAGLRVVATEQAPPPLIVHEWGTFTSVAGDDGQAMQWLPLGGPTDLPCFVETYVNRRLKVVLGPDVGDMLDYEQARRGLRGTVRMETPVLYFYADRAMTARVSVDFPQGLFTEFYPTAEVLQMDSYANILARSGQFRPARILWPSVKILPGTSPDLPSDRAGSHYYAARETDAAPIRVWQQDEKFLFYRGVAAFPVPLSATLETSGRVRVKNLGRQAMPAIVLLTKRGGAFGYRVRGELEAGAEAVLDAPVPGATLAALRQDLERLLVAQGLYVREARAMIETWRDDWFNDGTRVFYLLGAADVDAILPLTVTPAPASIVRAFVGRMEVITPASEADVARALATNDTRLLDSYGRWLAPMSDRILAKMRAPEAKAALLAQLDGLFKAYLSRVTACH